MGNANPRGVGTGDLNWINKKIEYVRHESCAIYSSMELPIELFKIICEFSCPLTIRALNKKLHKSKTLIVVQEYPIDFYQINYLRAMNIKPTFMALRIYFPKHNKWLDHTNTNSIQRCGGFTKKGIRCSLMCKRSFCHHHTRYKNTDAEPSLVYYRESKMYDYLMRGVI